MEYSLSFFFFCQDFRKLAFQQAKWCMISNSIAHAMHQTQHIVQQLQYAELYTTLTPKKNLKK